MAGQKIRKAVSWILIIFLSVCYVFSELSKLRISTYEFLSLVQIFLIVLLVKLLGQIKLPFYSYALLLLLLLCERQFLFLLFDAAVSVFYIADICLVIFLSKGSIRQYLTKISVINVCAVIMYEVYDMASTMLIPLYYDLGHKYSLSAEEKVFVIVSASAVFSALYVLSLRLIAKLLSKKRDLFEIVSEKFSNLEIYVFIFGIITAFFVSLISTDISGYWYTGNSFILRAAIIFADAAYICLLLKAASIKDRMNIAEVTKNDALIYNAELENTLDNMRDIRHDVKNLFMTMGGYIDASRDEEMKSFYYENIVPFVKDTVAKSELQDRLRILNNEGFKYFLYSKITQITELGINIHIEINSPFDLDAGQSDIVRLVGIFIDNAAEEATLTVGKNMRLKISEDDLCHTVLIGNDVRQNVKVKGIIAGTTEKGLGRGNGLLIAQKIISKYNNMVLNSYFNEDEFVQCLMIEK